MTATSERIEEVARGGARFLTEADADREVFEPLRADTNRGATMSALLSSGTAHRLIRGLHGKSARVFIEMLGGSVDSADLERVRRTLRESKPGLLWLFDLSYELHQGYRRMGITRLAAPESTVVAVRPSNPSAPFTGSGATGINPTTQNVPLTDQFQMLVGEEAVTAQYSNPLHYLDSYLDKLSAEQRRRQGQILTSLPISSIVPDSYVRLPSRRSVLEAAARRHNLHPELIAGFLLAEQRDQSQREDAKDYAAATSIMRANTSIGLGQVVVSTAQRHDLFSDLLGQAFRSRLGHMHVATLLSSDEFNIFAVAKFMRLTADAGAKHSAATLPETATHFPDIDFGAYARNSRAWPEDNIKALGSEYTSRAWDDRLATAWGWFVNEAYKDITGGVGASRVGGVRRNDRGRRPSRTRARPGPGPRTRPGPGPATRRRGR